MVNINKYCFILLLLILLPGVASGAHRAKTHFSPLKAALLVDADSGRVLYEHNSGRLTQPASLSKILTLYLINEDIGTGKIHLSDLVSISSKAVNTNGQKMLHEEGREVLLGDLIKGIAIFSANDAAVAVAEYVEGSVDKFVERMNAKARELGMVHSNFVNPNGLPDKRQLTTAHDIYILSREYLKRFPDMLHIHSIQYFRYDSIMQENSNDLLKDCSDVDGLKTGFVRAAGYHLVATAKRGDTRLIVIVLGAKNIKSRTQQTKKLLENGFRIIGQKKPSAPHSLIGA
jgi:serine-type D-Ala-D-Ala carboxypeptidase (penicillin-binding protein 5/6)